MKFLRLAILVLFIFPNVSATTGDTTKIYLFPGQGADYRQFKNLVLPPQFDTVYIHYPVPEKGMSMQEYAISLINQVDTSEKYLLIGVSLGGMICSELADILQSEKTILISSAKWEYELPGQYKFMRRLPIYKLIPKRLIKLASFIAQPLFEPDRRREKKTCIAMLKAKNPLFLKRTIHMIVNWKKNRYNTKIVHIHGTKDHTLPYGLIKADFTIPKGSHMMVLTFPNEINAILNTILLLK